MYCLFEDSIGAYTKVGDRSKSLIYMGKEQGTKANRLYDPKECSVFVSRDIVFQEDKIWS